MEVRRGGRIVFFLLNARLCVNFNFFCEILKKNSKKFEKVLDIPPPNDIISHFFHQGGF